MVHYRECPEVARVVTNAEIADKHKHFAAMRSNSTQNDMLLADNYDFADGNFLSDEVSVYLTEYLAIIAIR